MEPKAIINGKKSNVARKEEAGGAKKKRSGAMNPFKVALYMIRSRSGKSKSMDVAASKGMWNRLVGSMRPLHLQSNASPPPSIVASPLRSDRYDDVMQPPESPLSPVSSDAGNSSRYGSAVNLQELEREGSRSSSRYASAVNLRELDREGGDDEVLVVDDEMIDAKAEEFIAQFYHQMKLQRMDSIDRRFEEMNKRSIG